VDRFGAADGEPPSGYGMARRMTRAMAGCRRAWRNGWPKRSGIEKRQPPSRS